MAAGFGAPQIPELGEKRLGGESPDQYHRRLECV